MSVQAVTTYVKPQGLVLLPEQRECQCGRCREGVATCLAGRTALEIGAAETSSPAPSGRTRTGGDERQADVSPESSRPAQNLNQAPLRVIARREVLANRTRMYLECGHAIERRYTGWAHRARCGECLTEGRS